MVQVAQTSVVQIVIRIDNHGQIKDPELHHQFDGSNFLTVGTGFIVNDRGDIVTANHVLTSIDNITDKLGDEQIPAIAMIGIPQQGVEDSRVKITGATRAMLITIKATDPVLDIAIVAPKNGNIFAPFQMFAGATHLVEDKPTVAKINPQRPHDGAEIFTSGFPLGSKSIITTSGHIASAWSSKNVRNTFDGQIAGDLEEYTLDIRLNSGNSGGPLFLSRDQSVIGIIVSAGTIGKAVPSKYIVKMLDSNQIPWSLSSR